MKKIFVTGGAGYIGTTLVPELLKAGYEVCIYDNLMYNNGNNLIPFFLYPNFNFVKGDILDKQKLESVINNYDIVIHLAAIVGYAACRKDEKYAWDVNHTGTVNVIESLKNGQPIFFGSTGSNYGAITEGVCTEDLPLNPLSIYGKSKTAAEEEIIKYKKFVAYRFATAFGVSPRLRLDLLVNELSYLACTQKYLVIYESHFMRTFIHVKDIAKSFLFGIENLDKMIGNVYNVGSNTMNYSKKDIVNLIKDKVNVDVHFSDFDGDADKRNYIVSYEKINSLGFDTTVTVEQGIDELIKVFDLIKITNDYKNA